MAGSTSDAIAQPRSHVLWVAIVAALAASPSAREGLFAFLRRMAKAILLRLPRLMKPAVRKDFLSVGPGFQSSRPAIAQYASKSKQWQNVEPDTASNTIVDFGQGSFSEYDHVFPQWLAEGLRREGFQGLKPIQNKILPLALGGRDVVGIAPTGSGKTLAFLVPGLVHAAGQPPLRNSADGPIVLVLAPTRELAVQIGKVAEGLMKPSWEVEGGKRNGFNSAVLYGGARRTDQLETLRFQRCTHVVVATPGRLLDFLEHGAFTLNRCSFFVLDEGDRMLDFGFEPDVTAIAGKIRKDRQMLYFSATWPTEVESAALSLSRGQQFEKVFAKPVEAVETGDENNKSCDKLTLPGHEGLSLPPREIRQVVEVMTESSSDYFADTMDAKVPLLMKHLEEVLGGIGETPGKALIFVSTRLAAEELGTMVARHFGLGRCGIMHGARKQEQREATLEAFRTGRIRALVATDVVGRGVDIPHVSHVVIYDMPGDIETYVHRVGRTGRNGQLGTSITFFEPRPWNSEMAGELVNVLRLCGQVIPPELEKEGRRSSAGWFDDRGNFKEEDVPKWAVDESQLWRKAPPLDNSSTGLATTEELGEWHANDARVWAYSANGGQTEQGRFELRSGGKLRSTWGWGEWSLLPSAPHCPRPTRACPTNAPTDASVEASPSSTAKLTATSSELAKDGAAQKVSAPKVARHLALSWGGVTDVVSLDSSGLGFELVSRSGRPASTYKQTTIGKSLPGVSL